MIAYYPYTFLMREQTRDIPVLVYHFRSPKSHQWYIVRVEEFPNKFFGIKFYLKSDSLNPHKFNRLSGLNEPRPVINTCIAILMELAEKIARSLVWIHRRQSAGRERARNKAFPCV